MNNISVAIITHNRASHLRRCLDSLSAQTIKPTEIIVVDNASTDDTKQTIKIYTNRLHIRYLYSSKKGYSSSRNIAIRAAKYNTIAWIDDDCQALPNWIDEIKKSIQIGMYCFQGVDQDHSTNTFSRAQNLRTDEFRAFSQKLLNDKITISKSTAKKIYGLNKTLTFRAINSVDHRSFVYRKEILNQLPYTFDETLPSYFSADEWDILRRIRSVGHIVLLNPRIKVIHYGRNTLSGFMHRQIQYGRNDAIREWIDAKRRNKIEHLKPTFYKNVNLKKFISTKQLFLRIDIQIIRQLTTEHTPLTKKVAILTFFFLGKIIRYLGKLLEVSTNKSLKTPYKK